MLTCRTGDCDGGRQARVTSAITLSAISSENQSIKEDVHKTRTTPRRTRLLFFFCGRVRDLCDDEIRAEAVGS